MISRCGKLRCGNESEPNFMTKKRQRFMKGGNKFGTPSTLELHRREDFNKILKTSERKKNGDDDRKDERKEPKTSKWQE